MDSSIYETKINVELAPSPNKNNQDYVGGTNDKKRDYQTREYEDARSNTDGCARNIN